MAEALIRLAERAATSRVAVHLSGVSIAYELTEGGRYEAVAPATLSLSEGEFVSVVGPTGCGKSTLLNVAAGLIKPSTGRVEVFGRPLDGLNAEAGYLFQQDALMPWKTAIENIAIGLEIAGRPRQEALKTARGLLGELRRCIRSSGSETSWSYPSSRTVRGEPRAALRSGTSRCRRPASQDPW